MNKINNTNNNIFDSNTMRLNFAIEHINMSVFKSKFDLNIEQWELLIKMIEYRMKHGTDNCSKLWNNLLDNITCSMTVKRNMRMYARNKQMIVEYLEKDNIPCIMWIKKNGTKRIVVPAFQIEYILYEHHPIYIYNKHDSATNIFSKVSYLVIFSLSFLILKNFILTD